MRRNVAAIFLALFLVGCNSFKGLVVRVGTNAMAPTVKAGDTVFSDPIYYKYNAVARGEIVVVKDPEGKKNPDGSVQRYVKRIIGLGGDKIQVLSSKVYVNDHLLSGILGSGKYFSKDPVEDFGPVNVPQGEYFLVGDNIANSADSRNWKPSKVRLDDIYGKVTELKDKDTGEIRPL
jgi:signal peptidase I